MNEAWVNWTVRWRQSRPSRRWRHREFFWSWTVCVSRFAVCLHFLSRGHGRDDGIAGLGERPRVILDFSLSRSLREKTWEWVWLHVPGGDLAREWGVSRQAINRRKQKILHELRRRLGMTWAQHQDPFRDFRRLAVAVSIQAAFFP